MGSSSAARGPLLKTGSSWTWRSAENGLQFTSDAENDLQLDLAPPGAWRTRPLSRLFLTTPRGLPGPSPTGPHFQHRHVQLDLKNRWRMQTEAVFSRDPKSNRRPKTARGQNRRRDRAKTQVKPRGKPHQAARTRPPPLKNRATPSATRSTRAPTSA